MSGWQETAGHGVIAPASAVIPSAGPGVNQSEERHSLIRLSKAGSDTALKIAIMDLKPVAIGVQKVEGVPLAFIALPLCHTRCSQSLNERIKFVTSNSECIVCVIISSRDGINRETEPEFTQRKISAVIPCRFGGESKGLRIKIQATGQVANCECEVIESGQHVKLFIRMQKNLIYRNQISLHTNRINNRLYIC